MAIHDAAYPTRPASIEELRWRLLHLSEERIGHQIRRQAESEDAAYAAALRVTT